MTAAFRKIRPEDNREIASLVRSTLKDVHLDIPGTAYYDESLDELNRYYDSAPEKRAYFIMQNEDGKLIGGAGFAEYPGFEKCAELQKLYLKKEARGEGLGYLLLDHVCREAYLAGYRRIYLETHSVLEAAVHIYMKRGFVRIPKPEGAVHSAMDVFLIKELREGDFQ